MTNKLIKVVLLLTIMLAAVGLQAQTEPTTTTFCGDLDATSCAILNASSQVMAGVQSLAYDFDFQFIMTELGTTTQDNTTVRMNGNGAFTGSQAGLFTLNDPALGANYLTQLTGWLNSTQGEMSMTMTLPASSASLSQSDISFDARMVDGIVYMDAGQINGTGSSWIGINISSLFTGLMGDTDMSSLPGGNAATTPAVPTNFATVTRLPDRNFAGQSMAVFETTLDYGALFTDATLRDALLQSLNLMSGEGLSVPASAAITPEALAQIFAESSLRTERWIGIDDGYTYQVEVRLAFKIDMAAAAQITGEALTSTTPQQVMLLLSGGMSLYNFNQPLTVETPPNASLINPFTPEM